MSCTKGECCCDLKTVAQKALTLMDLTTLADDDTDERVIELCKSASTKYGKTAAICIYPRFIPIAKKTLHSLGCDDIRVATVTNFPHGNDDIEIAVTETKYFILFYLFLFFFLCVCVCLCILLFFVYLFY